MLKVEVKRVRTDELGEELWVARIKDPDYPSLWVQFEYHYEREGWLFRSGFSVTWDPTATDREEISMHQIRREFPVSEWERLAQLEVSEAIKKQEEKAGRLPVVAGPADGKGRRRKVDLQRVAEEYLENVRRGVPDPVAAIARRHRKEPATVRSWVFRARKEGYLGPAREGVAGVTVPTESGREEQS